MNKERFEKGMEVRRAVVGSEYVDRAIQNTDDFNSPLQELVTEYCWEKSGQDPAYQGISGV